MSARKSYISTRPTTLATSARCKVRRLFSSVRIQARAVSSRMKRSQALAKTTGASWAIMKRGSPKWCWTSSSIFMIFLIRARGSSELFSSADPTSSAEILRGRRGTFVVG